MGKPFPGPYDAKYFPWVREMHNCNDEKWIANKAAQVGITEVCLNRAFFTLDIKRVDCLYLLPSQTPDASNFSAGRFDPALELSPYLSTLFSDVMNVGHKRAGSTNLYIRGTRSRSQLKSIPAGLIVFDELDEMTQKNLSLASERTAGQTSYQEIKISTPTIAGRGIDVEFQGSTQEYFNFKCPSCSRFTELIYPDCLVITGDKLHDPDLQQSHLICKECKNKLHHETKFEWLKDGTFVSTAAANRYRGFAINGLYSSAARRAPARIAEQVIQSKEDPMIEQELFNSVLGKAHEVKGARVTDSHILECQRNYKLRPMINADSNLIITIGIDQGSLDNYYEIDMWLKTVDNPVASDFDVNTLYIPKLLDYGIVSDLVEIDRLIHRWKVNGGVVDGLPAKRAALDLANRFPGLITLCIYADGVTARNLSQWSNEPTISVDRTSWLDLSLGRFKNKTMLLPSDLSEDYKKHIMAPVRKPEVDRHGNPTARYLTGERVADHYAHARNYAEIALNFILTGAQTNEPIHDPRLN